MGAEELRQADDWRSGLGGFPNFMRQAVRLALKAETD